MTMDSRLQERRREVAEDRARVDVRRVVWLLVVLGSVGAAVWLVTSPMLSVRTISTFGATNAQVSRVLAAERVVEGRPLVAIRSASVAEALEADPWVRFAGVELIFPSHVEITIEERIGVAWVPMSSRWGLVADDGVLVAYSPQPTNEADGVQIRTSDVGLGVRIEEPDVLGAVVFLIALPDDLARRTSIHLRDGELWARVGERDVRLGRPIDMDAKASALEAIIGSAPPGVIDVIAPARPAVWSVEPAEG